MLYAVFMTHRFYIYINLVPVDYDSKMISSHDSYFLVFDYISQLVVVLFLYISKKRLHQMYKIFYLYTNRTR